MVKRKQSRGPRQKHQGDPQSLENTSDEEKVFPDIGSCCPHVTQSVNQPALNKVFKTNIEFGVCQGCLKANKKEPEGETQSHCWICLQCGYQGCEGIDKNHAFEHYKTPRSDSHALIFNLSSHAVKCYKCDDEIALSSSRFLRDTAEIVRKKTAKCIKKDNKEIKQAKVLDSSPEIPPSRLIGVELKENSLVNDKKVSTESLDEKKPKNIQKKRDVPFSPVKGLSNLGNTCFFNSVIQNLSRVKTFLNALKEQQVKDLWIVPKPKKEISQGTSHETIEVPLSYSGVITVALIDLLNDLICSDSKEKIIRPTRLFEKLASILPQFRSYDEQDSHELLRCLLDSIKMEEVKRQKKAILNFFDLSEKTNPDRVDAKLKLKLKEYGKQASFTVIDQVFSGELISCITCQKCDQTSKVFETFLDLSLPISAEKPLRPPHSKHCEEEETGTTVSKYQQKKEKKLNRKEIKNKTKALKKSSINTALNCSKEVVDPESSLHLKSQESPLSNGHIMEDQVELTLERNCKSLNVQEVIGLDHKNPGHEDETPDDEMANMTLEEESHLVLENVADNKTEFGEMGLSNYSIKNQVSSLEDEQQETNSISNHFAINIETDSPDFILDKESCASMTGSISEELKDASIDKNIDNRSILTNRTFKEMISEDSGILLFDESNLNTSESEDGKSLDANDGDVEDNLEPAICKSNISLTHLALDNIQIEELDYAFSRSSIQNEVTEIDQQNPAILLPGLISREDVKKMYTRSNDFKKNWERKSLVSLSPSYMAASNDCSIQSCLSLFTQQELLVGKNQFACQNCREIEAREKGVTQEKQPPVYCNASKQMLIIRPPAVLTLHLKRFEQRQRTCSKVNRFVSFDLILDIAPFCSALSMGLPNVNGTAILYSLCGVVVHSGRLNGGHYIAYIRVQHENDAPDFTFLNQHQIDWSEKDSLLEDFILKNQNLSKNNCKRKYSEPNTSNSQWYHVSDSIVKKVEESEVLRCQAYLLFYERFC